MSRNTHKGEGGSITGLGPIAGIQALEGLVSKQAPPGELIGFLVTHFEGHYPVGTAAIVYGHDREHAKRILKAELQAQNLGRDNPDEWTVEPITPPPATARARIVLNGDY